MTTKKLYTVIIFSENIVGLLNQIKKGSKRQLKKIGNEFSGVVLRTVPEQYLLEVLVERKV